MQKKVIIASLIVLATVACIAVWGFVAFKNHQVLEDFRVLEEKFIESNESLDDALEEFNRKISENEFKHLYPIALEVEASSNRLNNYIETLKTDMLSEQNMKAETMDFSKMDKPSQLLFKNNSERGKAFISEIELYKENLLLNLKGFSNKSLIETINNKFTTTSIDGKDWLNYEFNDFPIIASYIKLTALQSEIKNTKTRVFNLLLEQ